MKNMVIKSASEAQMHVDRIIRISEIIDYSEGRAKRDEICHIDVDSILAEPIIAPTRGASRGHNVVKHRNIQHTEEMISIQKPYIPNREKLITHRQEEYYSSQGLIVAIGDVIYSFFKILIYKSR